MQKWKLTNDVTVPAIAVMARDPNGDYVLTSDATEEIEKINKDYSLFFSRAMAIIAEKNKEIATLSSELAADRRATVHTMEELKAALEDNETLTTANVKQVEEIAILKAEVERLRKVLTEVSKGEGEFDIDPVLHAINTIAHMKSTAQEALKEGQEIIFVAPETGLYKMEATDGPKE